MYTQFLCFAKILLQSFALWTGLLISAPSACLLLLEKAVAYAESALDRLLKL